HGIRIDRVATVGCRQLQRVEQAEEGIPRGNFFLGEPGLTERARVRLVLHVHHDVIKVGLELCWQRLHDVSHDLTESPKGHALHETMLASGASPVNWAGPCPAEWPVAANAEYELAA